MTTPERHVEETKMTLPKNDIAITQDGHVLIKNARLVEKLKGSQIGQTVADGNTEITATIKRSF